MKAACFSCSFSLARVSERKRGRAHPLPAPHQPLTAAAAGSARVEREKSRIKAGRRSSALSLSCTLNEDWHPCAVAAAATAHRLQIRFSLGHRNVMDLKTFHRTPEKPESCHHLTVAFSLLYPSPFCATLHFLSLSPLPRQPGPGP
ncbi:hypothetical protein CEXT_667351 [Caerostris extrusa]|uniref:Uncharacterized protein n=1 Tax=Caerostris extrusa TaxID=172846 RepID=A0AAV4UXB6_CAEEX|nr:hypothetical protein CEXT_667351 [Caerostris extrusa]